MKKAFLLFMALSTFVLSAQNIDPNKKRDKEKPEIHFTPEQRAELRSKQMTLELDLNDSQQAKVKQLFLEKEKSRSKISEKRSEMTADEAFAFRNERLDRRLEIKRGLKEILTEEQFQKLDRTKFRKSSTYRNRREGMMKTRH
jgi:Spy/CpxP family protein refolding chaperone